MPRCIVKIGPWYAEWSTVVDAPVTPGMTLEELREYVRDRYGSEGIERLPERLARVEATGTSFYEADLTGTIAGNRAGPNESELTLAELIAHLETERHSHG